MDLKHLKYEKTEGNAELKKSQTTSHKIAQKKTSTASLSVKLPMGYEKEEPTLETNIIFVLSGGTKREKDYLGLLNGDRLVRRLKVAFFSKKGQGLHPLQMLSFAQRYLHNKKFETKDQTFSITEDDIIYLLSDVDEFESALKNALKNTEEVKQLRWIISNPAFEIWLFYHYFDNPKEILKECIEKGVDKRSQWLKTRLNELHGGGVRPNKSFELIKTAIKNSKKNYSEKNGIPELFATQMYVLAQIIVDMLGDELNEMINRRALQAKAFKEKNLTPIPPESKVSDQKVNEFMTDLIQYANRNPICLPKMDRSYKDSLTMVDAKQFVKSYKIQKNYFSEDAHEAGRNLAQLFMDGIKQDIEHYYYIQLLLHTPIETLTIDFSEIKEAMNILGLDGSYSVLSGLQLDTFDDLYGGEISFFKKSDGYIYGDVNIMTLNTGERSLYIMRKEYLPRVEQTVSEKNISNYQEVDAQKHIYSNVNNMQELPDGFGLSVMQSVHFYLPQNANFRYINLNIIDYSKDKSELSKLNRGDTIRLQYIEGDFVRIREKYYNMHKSIFSNNTIFKIEKINKEGTLNLCYMEGDIPFNHIEPVPIDRDADSQVYYDPIIAGSILIPGEAKPIHDYKDYSYYLDAFKYDTFEDGETLYDKYLLRGFRYVHEVQHWLNEKFGWNNLKIRNRK